jgi:tripartite ATP-independent transporter DctP family solute receptor
MNKIVKMTALAAAVALATAALSSQAQARMLRAGHSHVEKQATDLSFHAFGDKLKELSGGKFELTVFPNSQLGSERVMAEQVLNGALDISMVGGQQIENFYPLYAVTNIPYLFRDYEHVKKFIKSDVAYKYLLDATEDKGFLGLWFETCGPRSFYANKAIKTPDDLKGLKMRVPESPMSIATVKLMGGQPTPMSSTEVYSALQQSVIDGAENNFEFYVQSRHFEVAPYWSQDMHSMPPNVVIMSADTWESFSDEEKGWVKEAAKYARDFQMDMYDKTLKELYDKADSLGIHITMVDNKPFAEKTKSLIEEQKKDAAKAELIDAIQAIK